MAVRKKLVRETIRKYKGKSAQPIGIAWYKPEQWDLLLKVSQDSDQLEDTHFEWLKHAREKFIEMQAMGYKLEKVIVDIPELIEWANRQDCVIDGNTRAKFVSHKMLEKKRI